jgi:Fe2+ or Zn2+ uptake regulation protein
MYETRRSRVEQAILEYLRKHPDAQDTLDGIAEWWLPEENVKTRTATVEEALSQLVAKGLVSARRGTDAKIHYRIEGQSRTRDHLG